MQEFVCIRKCFYKDILYDEGDPYIAKDDEKVPHHFEPKVKVEEKHKLEQEEDQNTTTALREKLDAIGKPYDRRWGIRSLEKALHDARIEGLITEEKK